MTAQELHASWNRPAPTVSVVICCYTMDRWTQLVAAVDSALDQTLPPLEVVVVVDHCPELEEHLRRHFGSAVAVVPNMGRRGLSGARNSGVAAASGDVVAFLDDDARAESGWLQAHARLYADPEVAGAGGLVVPSWATSMPRWFPPEFGWVVGCSYDGQPVRTCEVRNPIGANMSFRRSVLLAAGGFNEDLGRVGHHPVGCEETELSIRVARTVPTARILHEPTAVVSHHVPAVRGRLAYFGRRCWAEGLSKAKVSRLSDPRKALATERRYVTRTLPKGLIRSLFGAVVHRDLWRVARAGALVAGLAVTSTGYVSGRLSQLRRTPRWPVRAS
jgi:glycosyltransferase involved in cell wall biosynthesis